MILDEDTIVSMQYSANQALYEIISETYHQVLDESDMSTAVGIVISAISTNLGAMLAKIPEPHRQQYMEVAQQIIEKSFMASIELTSENKWGQVGHA